MLQRKINAIISLLATLFLLIHAIGVAIWMLSKGSIPQFMPFASWILAGLMVAHAFIGIDLLISNRQGGETRKYKHYPKQNGTTVFQRVSGILLILFTALHIAGTAGPLQPPLIIHTIVPPLFFTIALAHTAVSVDKAFITLGIGEAKFVKAVSVVTKVICAATLVASVIGFYLYVW
jgi:succinate dehydrogenase/fumarate reductase cytochrome b subunit